MVEKNQNYIAIGEMAKIEYPSYPLLGMGDCEMP